MGCPEQIIIYVLLIWCAKANITSNNILLPSTSSRWQARVCWCEREGVRECICDCALCVCDSFHLNMLVAFGGNSKWEEIIFVRVRFATSPMRSRRQQDDGNEILHFPSNGRRERERERRIVRAKEESKTTERNEEHRGKKHRVIKRLN